MNLQQSQSLQGATSSALSVTFATLQSLGLLFRRRRVAEAVRAVPVRVQFARKPVIEGSLPQTPAAGVGKGLRAGFNVSSQRGQRAVMLRRVSAIAPALLRRTPIL